MYFYMTLNSTIIDFLKNSAANRKYVHRHPQLISEEFYVLGYSNLQFAESQQTLRRDISAPFAGLKSKPSKLVACFMPDSRLIYSLTLNMETTYSSETSIEF
jgi:hypothetical protein